MTTQLPPDGRGSEAGFSEDGSSLGTSAKEPDPPQLAASCCSSWQWLLEQGSPRPLLEKSCCKWHTANRESQQQSSGDVLPTARWWKPSCLHPARPALFFNERSSHRECDRCEGCPSFQAFPSMLGQALSRLIEEKKANGSYASTTAHPG